MTREDEAIDLLRSSLPILEDRFKFHSTDDWCPGCRVSYWEIGVPNTPEAIAKGGYITLFGNHKPGCPGIVLVERIKRLLDSNGAVSPTS